MKPSDDTPESVIITFTGEFKRNLRQLAKNIATFGKIFSQSLTHLRQEQLQAIV